LQPSTSQRTDRLAIVVYVERKRDDVPADQRVPVSIEGAPTDVVEGKFTPMTDPRSRARPVPNGVSAAPTRFDDYFGTLGYVVRDNANGQPMYLSNWHVLCSTPDWKQRDRRMRGLRAVGRDRLQDRCGHRRHRGHGGVAEFRRPRGDPQRRQHLAARR